MGENANIEVKPVVENFFHDEKADIKTFAFKEEFSKVYVKRDVKAFFLEEQLDVKTPDVKERSTSCVSQNGGHSNGFLSDENTNGHTLFPVFKQESSHHAVMDNRKLEVNDPNITSAVEEKPCIEALRAVVEAYSANQGTEKIDPRLESPDEIRLPVPEGITNHYISTSGAQG